MLPVHIVHPVHLVRRWYAGVRVGVRYPGVRRRRMGMARAWSRRFVARRGTVPLEIVDDVAEQVRRCQDALSSVAIASPPYFLADGARVDAEDVAIRGTVPEGIGILTFGHDPSEAPRQLKKREAVIIRQKACGYQSFATS